MEELHRPLGLAAALTGVLALLHLGAPRFRRLPGIPESWTVSFGGGLAVAYVFLHLLPGLEGAGEAFRMVVVGDGEGEIPILELAEWSLALAGLALYLGLELRATRSGGESGPAFYRLHLGAYLLVNLLVTFTLLEGMEGQIGFAYVFTLAMGVHFIMNDRALVHHHPRRFSATGRYLLAGALVAGFAIAAVLGPHHPALVGGVTSFLAGATLLNVFKEEVHIDRETSYPAFLVGAATGVALLVLVTLTEG